MLAPASLLVFLHVAANVVWIGSVAAVGMVLKGKQGTPRERGALALGVYQRLAVPAFVGSFVAGIARLALDLDTYFVLTKFMHGKLFFALVVIALHHTLGAAAKRMASGRLENAPLAGYWVGGLLASATAAVFLAVVRPF